MTLFLDLDGVLADFDGHYAAKVGPLPDRSDPDRDVDWHAVASQGFFASMPPMADAFDLWHYAKRHDPVILTGVPTIGSDQAAEHKRAWVRNWFGLSVPVLTCRSKEKSFHASTGDVLVDDWSKYRKLWEAKGGIWVAHTNAADSIAQLRGLGL